MADKRSDKQNQLRPVSALARWHIREYRVLDILSEFLHWFEVILAGISVAFVAIGVIYLTVELFHFRESIEQTNLHTSYEELLSDILLLVVGIELALMLVRRTPESLIERHVLCGCSKNAHQGLYFLGFDPRRYRFSRLIRHPHVSG